MLRLYTYVRAEGDRTVDCWLPRQFLPVSDLHDDVEERVEHHIGNKDCEHEGGKITALISQHRNAIAGHSPVDGV